MPRLVDSTPQPSWINLPGELASAPVLDRGGIVYLTSDYTRETLVSSIDIQSLGTGAPNWTVKLSPDGVYVETLVSPLIADGVFYVGAEHTVYAVDASTGKGLWTFDLGQRRIASQLLFFDGKLFFGADDDLLYALDNQGSKVWSAGPFTQDAELGWTVASGHTVVLTTHSSINALDVQTGDIKWSHYLNANTTPSISNGYLYVGDQSGSVYVFDVETGVSRLLFNTGREITSSVACYHGVVYFGSLNGNFYAVDAVTGAQLWTTGTGGRFPTDNLFIEDNIIYFLAEPMDLNGPSTSLFAIDILSLGSDIASCDIESFSTIFSVDTGTCYCAKAFGQNVAGLMQVVNLATVVREFFAESELIVEDYIPVGQPGEQVAQGNSTSYRTHILLVDENKNPRSNTPIKIWASDAVTITSGGQTYDLDVDKSAWLQTDATGELSIVSSATEIASPALKLWGAFMLSDETIIIYPDHQSLSTVSNIQGAQLDPATAVGYDNQPILQEQYRSPDQRDQIASSIRNAMGSPTASLSHVRSLSDTPAKYIAYPDSTPALVYHSGGGDAPRPYRPGDVSNWTLTLDGKSAAFSPASNAAEVDDFIAKMRPPIAPMAGGLGRDFKHFAKKVVHGAEHVASVAWKETEGVVNATINTVEGAAEGAYDFAVDTVEKAAAVAAGILKSVVGAVDKAIQWLSFLFKWEDILEIHKQISDAVKIKFGHFQKWIDAAITTGIQDGHTFFGKAERDVVNSLDWAISNFGGQTLQSLQHNNNNPQTVYGAGGAKSYTKSRWLLTKFQDNAGKAKIIPSSAGLAAGEGDEIVGAFKSFYEDVASMLSSQGGTLLEDLEKVSADFGKLFTDPSAFVTHKLGDVLSLFRDLAVTLLKFADIIVESFLKLMKGVIDSLLGMLKQKIDIPVLSDLYKLLAKKDLSILDLCSLIVAVPTTVLMKALGSASKADFSNSHLGSAPVLNMNIGYLCAYCFYTVMDPIMDLLSPGAVLSSFYLGLSVILIGLNFPDDLATNTDQNYIFYALGAFPLVLTGLGIKLGQEVDDEDAEFAKDFQKAAPQLNCGYGIIMILISLALGSNYPDFAGKKNLTMFQNIFTYIPYVAKPLADGGTVAKVALVLADVVGDLTSYILGFAEYEISNNN